MKQISKNPLQKKMVIMANKVNRLSERPKPPSWEETQQDVAEADKNDVVFEIGKDYLPNISGLNSKTTDSGHLSNTESDADTSLVDQSKIEASYAAVLRLITLNEEMKNVPTELIDQYTKLKAMGADMTQSVKDLKAMALSIPTVSEHKTAATKSKQKKKK